MDKIHWWLLKHEKIFLQESFTEQNNHITHLKDGSTIRLPPFNPPNEDQIFLCIYQALETISEFHRNEIYFRDELLRYNLISSDPSLLKNWIIENEVIGADNYAGFFIDYLDYGDDVEHIKVFILYAQEWDLYIDKADFQHTIQFLEIFNKLYWENDILQKFN